MKTTILKLILICLICLTATLGATAWGDGIKERMLQRQPAIIDLKNQGIVGETNTGYLGYVTAQQSGQEVVSAENADRKAVYTHIAGQQNISVDLVGKRRALQLLERATPGHFYQDQSGAWIKK